MKFTRTSIAAFAVAALLSGGCYDDPLDEGRGDATVIEVNRSESFLTVGKPFTITAKAIDAQMTPMPVTLSATASSGLTITSITYVEELRETRIVVTPTAVIDNAPGTVTITGEGLSQTVDVWAYPKAIQGNVADELLSGETVTPTVSGFSEDGGSLGDVAFSVTSDDASVIEVGSGGELIAKGVGTVTLTFTGPGGSITDEVSVTVVPGTFAGTATATTYQGSQAVRLTPGAVPFDSDTEVQFGDNEGEIYTVVATPNEVIAVLPYGTAAGTISFIVARVGASQLALRGTYTAPTASTEPFEPANDAPGAGAKVTNSGSIIGQMGPTDVDDFFLFEVTEGGDYEVILEWGDGADIDMFVLDPANLAICGGDMVGCAMATGDNPEHGEGTFVAGTTYIGYVNLWTADGTSDYRVTFRKQ